METKLEEGIGEAEIRVQTGASEGVAQVCGAGPGCIAGCVRSGTARHHEAIWWKVGRWDKTTGEGVQGNEEQKIGERMTGGRMRGGRGRVGGVG